MIGSAGSGSSAEEVEVPVALDGMRLDRAVSLVTGLPRSASAHVIASGGVTVAGAIVTARSRRMVAGERVRITPAARAEEEEPGADATVPFQVIWADAHAIVVDKPAGVVVHPGAGVGTGTLVNGLLAAFPDLGVAARAGGMGGVNRPGIVHRLDKGTSGLLVVARDADAYTFLGAQIRRREARRDYLALVDGEVEAAAGVIDAPIGRSAQVATRMAVTASGRDARTRYEVLRRWTGLAGAGDGVSEVEAHLETGRTHQIRVHFAAIGHPIVGDERYGGRRCLEVAVRGEERAAGADVGASDVGASCARVELRRPFLHAHRLVFDHPVTGERMAFTSPLPAELAAVLDALGSSAG